MQVITLNSKQYYAQAPRPSSGLYPYTCDAFKKTAKGHFPITSQIKLYQLAPKLKGEAICKEI